MSETPKFVFNQWFAGGAVTMLIVQIGLVGGWSSPSLARLRQEDSDIPLTSEQAGLVGSLVNASRVFGVIAAAVLASLLGSKKAIFFTGIPLTVGWVFIVMANRVELLYVSRLFSGLGLGMSLTVFPLFIGEISMPEIRGALISLAIMGGPIGQVLASVCGAFLSIKVAAVIYTVMGLVLMALFLWLPESPHHLVKRGNTEAARDSIAWYRSGYGVGEELDAVQKFVAADGELTFAEKCKELVWTPWIRSATIMMIILMGLTQMSGLNVIMFFMEKILKRAQFTMFEASVVVIVSHVLCLLATASSIFLIDRCGRKFLLILSSFGCMTAMIGLGAHFLLLEHEKKTNLQWLPMASVSLFMMAVFVGHMPAPNAILSEVFPANIKSIVAFLANVFGAATSFVSSYSFFPGTAMIGDAAYYLLYALVSLFLIPYTLIFIRETKGKSLQQIRDELMGAS